MVGIVFVSSFNWYYMHGSRMCITDTKTKLTELVVSKIHGRGTTLQRRFFSN